jgi:hypothetical protein
MKPDTPPPPVTTIPVAFWMSAPIVAGIAVNVVVEALGFANLLGSRTAWGGAWLLGAPAAVLGLRLLRRHLEGAPDARRPPPEAPVLGAISAILAVTLLTALISPPNTYDALTYHNSRVMQWWDHGHLGFWETSIPRQLLMPPLASYFRLSLYGLTGLDLLFNAVQWLFFGYTIFGAWALAESLAPGRKAGRFAALLVATMPMAVLQSTSSQNDLVCAGYVVAAAFFLVRVLREETSGARTDLTLLGGAVGLALLTKGTAIPLALPLLAVGVGATLLRAVRSPGARTRTALGGALAGVALAVLLDLPHTIRVLSWFPSAQDCYPEVVRVPAYLQDGLGTGAGRALSQLTRNGVLQLGQLRSLGVRSAGLVEAVSRLHARLGIDVDDPSITYRGSHFEEARWQLLNHEDTASSTIHFLLALFSPLLLLSVCSAEAELKRRTGSALAFGWTLWALFCFFVVWMPWNQRLQLPVLILLMAPAAAACSTVPRLGRALAVVTLVSSLPYLFLNFSRPLLGLAPVTQAQAWRRLWTGSGTGEVRSILTTSRWAEFFRNAPGYRETVEESLATIAAECPDGAVVGLRVRGNFPEYLFWVGARHLGRDFRFRHLGALSASEDACAVLRVKSGGVEVVRNRRSGSS